MSHIHLYAINNTTVRAMQIVQTFKMHNTNKYIIYHMIIRKYIELQVI